MNAPPGERNIFIERPVIATKLIDDTDNNYFWSVSTSHRACIIPGTTKRNVKTRLTQK
jgi:hypothetical protein